jgi:hypothetical protein
MAEESLLRHRHNNDGLVSTLTDLNSSCGVQVRERRQHGTLPENKGPVRHSHTALRADATSDATLVLHPMWWWDSGGMSTEGTVDWVDRNQREEALEERRRVIGALGAPVDTRRECDG